MRSKLSPCQKSHSVFALTGCHILEFGKLGRDDGHGYGRRCSLSRSSHHHGRCRPRYHCLWLLHQRNLRRFALLNWNLTSHGWVVHLKVVFARWLERDISIPVCALPVQFSHVFGRFALFVSHQDTFQSVGLVSQALVCARFDTSREDVRSVHFVGDHGKLHSFLLEGLELFFAVPA